MHIRLGTSFTRLNITDIFFLILTNRKKEKPDLLFAKEYDNNL